MEESSLRNDELILNLNESLSISTSSKKIKKNSNSSNKNKNIYSSYSSQSTKKMKLNNDYRRTISGYFNHNDKVEKKMYLENINIRTKRNSELLSKLASTFRSCRMQLSSNDPKIESNLFRIGVKRSFLLAKRVNQVRNLIQDFDNEFTVNLNINKKIKSNKNTKKKFLQKIEEESFDFDLNNIKYESDKVKNNNNNAPLKSSKSLKKKTLLILNDLPGSNDLLNIKGKKFLKLNEIFEKKLKNSEKFSQLEDAFKYYELLYNYKYFLTKKDNEFLSFSRRREMERALSSYYLNSKKKISKFEDSCEKCKDNKKSDLENYRNSKRILSSLGNSDIENNIINFNTPREYSNNDKKKLILSLDSSEKSKKNLKRAFSGFMPQKTYNDNIYTSNNNYSIFNNKTRPATSSINQTAHSSKYSNSNKLHFKSKIKTELDLDSAISNTSVYNTNLIYNKKHTTINSVSLKKKIRNLSEGILDIGDKLKTELKSNYKSTMKQIEEEKKAVKKVKKDRNININKIRTDLNLKRRGKGIDETKLIMGNVNKLYKSLPKNHVHLMRSIARIVINEDRMRHKPLIYNDIYDNKLFKMRLKNEMFQASREMGKIRATLSKNKKEKNFKEQMKKIMGNDMFLFFNLNSLKQMVNKYKVLKGECISNNDN